MVHTVFNYGLFGAVYGILRKSSTNKSSVSKKHTVGFSQVGAESVWRITNTSSIKKAAEAAG
jgi:hypothetical protein